MEAVGRYDLFGTYPILEAVRSRLSTRNRPLNFVFSGLEVIFDQGDYIECGAPLTFIEVGTFSR